MKTLFTLLCVLISFVCHSQHLTKGIIIPKNGSKFSACCIYIPKSGLDIYDNPKGTQTGKIVPDNIESSSLHQMTSEMSALIYVEQVDNFVKIKANCWLSITELSKHGLTPVNWMRYLIDNSPNVLGYYANNPGLNLRKSPSIQSEVILTLKGDLLEIKLTKEIKGLWCKVDVTAYTEHPCASKGNFTDIKQKSMTGWIKLLSDDLTPNVSYYPKGC